MIIEHSFLKVAVEFEKLFPPDAIGYLFLWTNTVNDGAPSFFEVTVDRTKVQDDSEDSLRKISSLLASAIFQNQELANLEAVTAVRVSFADFTSRLSTLNRFVIATKTKAIAFSNKGQKNQIEQLCISKTFGDLRTCLKQSEVLQTATQFELELFGSNVPGVSIIISLANEKEKEEDILNRQKSTALKIAETLMDFDSTLGEVSSLFVPAMTKIKVARNIIQQLKEDRSSKELILHALESHNVQAARHMS